MIEERIDYIENLPSSEINVNEKRKLEQELDSIYDNILKGAQIISKAKWISEDEQNTIFFLGLEKKHQTNNTLLGTKNDNDILISNGENPT